MKRSQSGFTLIEIAIVLVIIGLLLGGILKGQELINSAKVKNLATDFRNVPVYIYGYQDKFKALPGDDRTPDVHLGASANCAGGACPIPATLTTAGNGVIDGAWNSATTTDESYLFWQHVRLAGLATGATVLTDPTYLPTNAVGGTIGVQSGTAVLTATPIKDKNGIAIRGTYIICSTGILGKFVKQLDTQMDDGATDTGSMLAAPTTGYTIGAPALSSTAATWDDAAPYTVCMGV